MHNCPSCQSDRTQRLEMAHATLTATLASALMSPPSPRSATGAGVAAWIGGILLVLAFVAVVGGAGSGALIVAVPGGLIFALAAMSLSAIDQYNTKNLPPLLAEWRRKWVCLTCGVVFVPSSETAAESPAPGESPSAGSVAEGEK